MVPYEITVRFYADAGLRLPELEDKPVSETFLRKLRVLALPAKMGWVMVAWNVFERGRATGYGPLVEVTLRAVVLKNRPAAASRRKTLTP